MDQLDKDIAELKEAMNKFIVKYDYTNSDQAANLAYFLKDVLEERDEFKTKEEYDAINESYYDSGCSDY